MMQLTRFWPLAAAFVLGGCLLPQPDTPVIPPFAPGGAMTSDRAAAPAAAPAPKDGEGLISNDAGGLISSGGGEISHDAGGLIKGEAGSATGNTSLAPAAPATGAALEPGTLGGTIKGLVVKRVTAVSEFAELAPHGADVDATGAFKLSLPPGGYYLEVEVNGKALRVGKLLVVQPGEVRTLTLTLQENPPKATLTEEAPLAAPSPSPSPTAKP
jgi:hypothetical protein